jgi:hypothetical protein
MQRVPRAPRFPQLLSRLRRVLLALLGAALLLSPGAPAGAGGTPPGPARPGAGAGAFQIGLIGDLLYTDEELAKWPNLMAALDAAPLSFVIHDGDFKSGSSRCDDATFEDRLRRFQASAHPFVFIPGDNEWTDCHRLSAGGYDNLERLQHLRAVMFARPRSFGRRTMALERQSAAYPENTRWTLGKIVYVAINVPGSNNNKVDTLEECMHDSSRTPAHCAADNAEYAARDAAVRQWVQDSFELARARRAAGIMIVMQANPGFDLPGGRVDERLDPEVDGYTALLDTLVTETKAFGGQVALVHGDTHYFRVDKPLVAPTNLLPNLTRVETFGSPNVAWVKATIDPESRTVFTFEPMLLPGS